LVKNKERLCKGLLPSNGCNLALFKFLHNFNCSTSGLFNISFDEDVVVLREKLTTKMNLEMASTDEMVAIAGRIKPQDCCLVPEKREELTTEGGARQPHPHLEYGVCLHAGAK
jgi:hypothetical protein